MNRLLSANVHTYRPSVYTFPPPITHLGVAYEPFSSCENRLSCEQLAFSHTAGVRAELAFIPGLLGSAVPAVTS